MVKVLIFLRLDFLKVVDVELPDEGGQVVVLVVLGQDRLGQLVGIEDDEGIRQLGPTDIRPVVGVLTMQNMYVEHVHQLHDEGRNFLPLFLLFANHNIYHILLSSIGLFSPPFYFCSHRLHNPLTLTPLHP